MVYAAEMSRNVPAVSPVGWFQRHPISLPIILLVCSTGLFGWALFLRRFTGAVIVYGVFGLIFTFIAGLVLLPMGIVVARRRGGR